MDNDLVARIVIFVVMAGSGSALIWMARAAASGRLKRNSLAGIRVPSTMASDEAWLAAHKRAKRPTLITGVIAFMVAASTLLPVPTEALAIGVLVGGILMLLVMMWGTRVGTKAAKKATDHTRA